MLYVEQVYYLPVEARTEIHTDLCNQKRSLCEVDIDFLIPGVIRTIEYLNEWLETHQCDWDCIGTCDGVLERKL
ncbi:hypothetical protein KHA80_06520 [Anaerobacillus sp. HL2]|nr:hypothetical protein KHA80_06520 [Anaerobacillus sp. HL2]